MEDGLQFSEEAELNRYLFYSDLNEINFFVEDKDKEYEYETIFLRLFNGKYKIASIIAAGGKQGVREAFVEFGETDKSDPAKHNFFLVDGDFDRYIHTADMIKNDHFIYLKYYNIENYFIDEKAIIKFLKGQIHVLDAEVCKKVKYSEWKNKIVEQAKPLFLLYCAVQKILPQEPNVARKEYLFIDSETGFAREGAYQDYYNHIVALEPTISEQIETIANLYERIQGNDYFGLICGKFLLISLFSYLRKISKRKFSKNDLRWARISEFDVSSLDYIRERVENVVEHNGNRKSVSQNKMCN